MSDWSLEIHHINVSGGDATIIALKSDPNDKPTHFKMLIDGGCEGSGFKRLKAYVEKYFDDRPFDYLVASHYHNDHVSGLYKCEFPITKFIDLGGYGSPVQQEPVNGIGVKNSNSVFYQYTQYIKEQEAKNTNPATRQAIPFIKKTGATAGPLTIPVSGGGIDSGFVLSCHCAGGINDNQENLIARQTTKHPNKIDPNDLSICFLLHNADYSFIYYTAGDLSGDQAGSSYYNVEQPYTTYLHDSILSKQANFVADKCNVVVKATHHGSDFCNPPPKTGYPGFFQILKTNLIVVPSNQLRDVPGPDFLKYVHTYAAGSKVPIYWLNDMGYTGSSNRFTGLKQIAASADIPSNLTLSNDQKTVTNGTPIAITVQVKSSDAAIKNIHCKGTATKRPGRPGGQEFYTYVNEDDLPAIDITVKIRDKPLPLPPFNDKDDVIQSIKKGFKRQANDAVFWLFQDRAAGKTTGQDFLKKWFSAIDFDPTITLIADNPAVPFIMPRANRKRPSWEAVVPKSKKALTDQMTRIFDDVYAKNAENTENIFWFVKSDSSIEDRETAFYLLVRNSRQKTYNMLVSGHDSTLPNYYNNVDPYQDKAQKQQVKRSVAETLVDDQTSDTEEKDQKKQKQGQGGNNA